MVEAKIFKEEDLQEHKLVFSDVKPLMVRLYYGAAAQWRSG